MATLAIKGHATRGKEVIEILEMLGGQTVTNDNVYYIIDDGKIRCASYDYTHNHKCFTLEQFLEKFPYKVGDKVSSKYLKNYKIDKMEWDDTNNRVIYKLKGHGWYSPNELQPYKEQETMKETNEDLCVYDKLDFTQEPSADKVELILGDYEIKEENGKTYLVKKQPQYPKTYEECCDLLDIYPIYNKPNLYICEWYPETREMHEHYSKLAVFSQKEIAFMKLRICRDAYWKIAGDWKPDFVKGVYSCTIRTKSNKVIKDCGFDSDNSILAFPTEEMRDVFYENFKELIEECKELL